jgi:hypothetical protein
MKSGQIPHEQAEKMPGDGYLESLRKVYLALGLKPPTVRPTRWQEKQKPH